MGVVTNLEPWILGGWNNKYTISGQDTILVPADTGCMCYANSRKSNDTILGHYLDLIAEMYDSLDSKGFFNPSVHPNADTSLQNLDELYMGTVHWKWHYFSQAKSYFPNGDFSLYVGERGGKHYFDILLSETYCSFLGINCMALACTDEEITKLCYNDIDPYANWESTGKCSAWFRKHYFERILKYYKDNANAPLPIDSTPMLLGHAAHMFDTYSKYKATREYTRLWAECLKKNNYKGSFTFKYDSLMALPHSFSLPIGSINCDNQAITDNNTLDTNSRTIVVFPNPADQKVTLKGLYSGDIIYIFNMNMEIELQSYHNEIDIKHLLPGYYIIAVQDINKIFVNRQILQIQRP